jgi:quercetin dioxygenase-like cupin family protein
MDAVIQEIPPGKSLAPKQHFYEQLTYVLAGRGYTTFGSGKNKVEWGEGSLFAVPMNVLHRHFNSDSAHPARLLYITTFPFMLQMFGSMGLINDLNFSFTDRYDGAADYFTSTSRVRKRWDKTNFVKDIRKSEVVDWPERGESNASMYWDMAGNTILEPHMSEFDVGSYKLGHRHPYEAIIVTLNGKGYSLAEKEKLKDTEAVKIDWQAGSIVSPPFFWYHQHFNTGNTKARYLAITEGDFPLRLGFPLQVEQIEAPQEDPEIKKRFERELHHG